MIPHRETIRIVKTVVAKDLLLEPVSRRVALAYSILGCGFLLWAGLAPKSAWFFRPVMAGISEASQVFIVLAIFAPFLIPFVVFMSIISEEKQIGSFMLLRVLPISPTHLLWSRTISCWFLSIIPVAPAYILVMFMHASGLMGEDLLTPIWRGIRFPVFLMALASLTSTSAVGLAMNISPRLIPVVATTLGLIVILFPFVFSQLIIGIKGEYILIRLAQAFGTLLKASAFLLLLSFLVGCVSSAAFCRKRSYV